MKVDFVEVHKKDVKEHRHRFVMLTDTMLVVYDENAVEQPDQPKYFKSDKQYFMLDLSDITNGKDQMREISIRSGQRECTLICRNIEHKNEWLKSLSLLKVKSCLQVTTAPLTFEA